METTEDEARLGRPFSVRKEGLIAKVREQIQEERCATVRMMAHESGVEQRDDSSNLSGRLGQEKGRFLVSAPFIV